MKKVLSALFLTSLLAVLIVPTMASAIENCQNWVCQGTVGNVVPCRCGTEDTANTSNLYCCGSCDSGKGDVFTSQASCQSAMSGGTTGGTEGLRQIPTNVPSTPGELVALIKKIGDWIFTILLAVAAIFLVVAGFYFITAGGNPEQTTKARQMLINALIGVAIALGARGLVAIIEGFILK